MQETACSSWTVALEVQGSLALDTLHLSGGDLQIDSDSNGASTLTVNTLNWLAPQSLVSGSAQAGSVDDGLLVGSGGMNINTAGGTYELQGLNISSLNTALGAPAQTTTLRLTGDTSFNVTSSLALAGGARASHRRITAAHSISARKSRAQL